MKTGILGIKVSTILSEMVFIDHQSLTPLYETFPGASLEETSFSEVLALFQAHVLPFLSTMFATEVHVFLNSLTNHPINESDKRASARFFPGSILHLYDESEFVLRCQKSDFQGILVSLGTSSFCAMKTNHQITVVGQYPLRLVNHGSAYQIGILALTHLAKAMDGIYAMTPFVEAVQKQTNIYDRLQLLDYMNHAKRIQIAEIAKIVTLYAPVNQHAYRILANQADEVQTMVDSFITISLTPPPVIILHGGVLMADTMYRHLILQNLRKISPSSTIELAQDHLLERFVLQLMTERRPAE